MDSRDAQPEKHQVARNFNSSASGYDAVAVLQQNIAHELLERLELVRLAPERILDLGSGTGFAARLLRDRYRSSRVIHYDLALSMLLIARRSTARYFSRQAFVCGDAEQLPFSDDSFDLVFSNLMLQWCHHLEPVFSEVRRILRPEGLFIFSSFGPDTLKELRASWRDVDDQVHVNEFLDMHDVGDALLRCGFAGPVMEMDFYSMTFSDVTTLMRELKELGAQNVNPGRRRSLTGKGRLRRLEAAYECWRRDGRLPATYEVIIGHAWHAAGVKTQMDPSVAAVPVSSIRRRQSS